jgi:excinuclease ABC subunit A
MRGPRALATRPPGKRRAAQPEPALAGRNGGVPWLTVRHAAHHNLKSIDVSFPLGRFTCVTGVSGSGKSSLVNDILYKALARDLNGATTVEPGPHAGIDGLRHLDKVIAIDQSPIGRTPRSNPATYIKVFDEIRALFAKLPDAKLRGYKPGRFSFNVPNSRGGGRCEACEGNGASRIEMDFLADVWVTCPVCEGHRFSHGTLQIRYKGKSIADVLEMEVGDALAVFEHVPRVRAMLQTLHDVGLDYIHLGQPSTTLSGGEAQRIKLARELVKKGTGRTLYVLDEPTTGLHFDDIRKLLAVLHGFVDAGNTVVVIEHNLDVVKTADWIIDLGPEGGDAGGRIVADGTPEEVAANPASYTGQALREVLSQKLEIRSKTSEVDVTAPRARGLGTTDVLSTSDSVTVVGARQHNLKDLTVSFPRTRTTVCTGVSGSGKSSFAIDTVFTEGYRRYVESLSAYARQFLGQIAKPRVDHVAGLSPAICIEQRAAGKSPRSTVGTVTEIYDYMRVLWARVGRRYCPRCAVPVGTQTADEIVARVMAIEPGAPIVILAPISLGDGETYAGLFNRLKSSGYLRVRIDGEIRPTAEATTLDVRRKHRVEVVVDRTVVRPKSRARIAESVEHALALGNGVMALVVEEVETVEEPVAISASPADEASEREAQAGANATTSPALHVKKTPAREFMFSQKLVCTQCGTSFEELGPNHFSFNSQLGWCETCEGLGVQRGAPAAAIIDRPSRTLFDGAIAGWYRIERRSPLGRMLLALCEHLGVQPDAPLRDWTPEQKRALMFGTGAEWIDAREAFGGVRFQWRGFFPTIDHATRNSWSFRHKLRNVVTDIPCVTCRGGRLRADAAAVRLGQSLLPRLGKGREGVEPSPYPLPTREGEALRGKTIVEVCEMPLDGCAQFFRGLELDERERRIAGELLHEIRARLQFLIDVGLQYLTLHRAAPTLAGGEAQRIRLASQIGSGLSGVLYVLDEPTIGLHPRDTARLIAALTKLRDLGNTLLLVEHDRDVIRSADRLLDFGPRAGAAGGRIVAEGPPADFLSEPRAGASGPAESLTRAYLSGAAAIPIPSNRRPVEFDPALLKRDDRENKRGHDRAPRPHRRAPDAHPAWLLVRGARQHNLKDIDVPIPLGRLVCVTGVSGSGKSSLVSDILWPVLANALHGANLPPGEHERIEGIAHLDQVINVDQSPIGSTPSSNPATYTGTFDWIRELFARLPDSKVRGYNANRFSFNRPGGRCEACEGYGQRCIEMHFMPDVWVECETCHGRRYNPETLEVRFKGKNIADVLDLRVAEALALFENVPKVRRMLQTLADVGLDYVQLGQPSPTLSGGEAQRVKLAAELGKPDTGRTFYLLDEPTTGLHFDDIRKLLAVVHRLVDLGNTVLVVEHNLDVIKCADWIIDLGPEAGDAGGHVVAVGTPEEITPVAAGAPAGRRTPEAPTSLSTATADTGVGRYMSHTAVALAPVLAAGPYEARTPYDPAAHAAAEIAVARAGLGKIGREVQMPWQVDGRKWHLEQRSSREATPRRWEPAALEYVLDLVHKMGQFEPTDWNNQASVEITAPGAPIWFLHALTGGEWLLELYFRVPSGTFHWRSLDAELGLKTLDERDDLESYGDWSRVDVRPRRDGLDAVVIYVHDKSEIDTPAFRRFIKQAVRAYLERVASPGG